MEFETTPLDGVLLLRPRVVGDDRGFFLEAWNQRLFEEHGVGLPFVQDNHSHSSRHVLRGLHYQLRQPQGKLVRVVSGAVFDVAVDMRRNSPSFGRWWGCVLSAENRCLMWIPPGFAHGFLVLSETADVLYKCTDYYAPSWDRALRWDDPAIGIRWPLPAGASPILSAKDAGAPTLERAEFFP